MPETFRHYLFFYFMKKNKQKFVKLLTSSNIDINSPFLSHSSYLKSVQLQNFKRTVKCSSTAKGVIKEKKRKRCNKTGFENEEEKGNA